MCLCFFPDLRVYEDGFVGGVCKNCAQVRTPKLVAVSMSRYTQLEGRVFVSLDAGKCRPRCLQCVFCSASRSIRITNGGRRRVNCYYSSSFCSSRLRRILMLLQYDTYSVAFRTRVVRTAVPGTAVPGYCIRLPDAAADCRTALIIPASEYATFTLVDS